MFHKIMSCVLTVYVLYSIVKTLRDGKLSFGISIWKRFTWRMFGENLLLMVYVMVAVVFLSSLPFLKWGWMRLLTGGKGNMLFAPFALAGNLSVVVSALFIATFVIALIAAFPFLAHYEEKLFRFKKLDRRSVVINSVVFGLIHPLLAGISIGAGIALIGSGFILAFYYRRAYLKGIGQGEEPQKAHDEALLTSTTYHTMFNTMVVLLVVITALLSYFIDG